MRRPVTRTRGFSLIELLVVIAIIGILAPTSVFSFRQIAARARDSQRLSDMALLQKALSLYYAQVGTFPGQTGTVPCGWGWMDSSAVDEGGTGDLFIGALAFRNVVGRVPVDPLNNLVEGCPDHSYFYNTYGAGSKGCGVELGPYYILAVKSFEGVAGIHPDSPRFSCPDFNWETEYGFAWVTGGFANQQ